MITVARLIDPNFDPMVSGRRALPFAQSPWIAAQRTASTGLANRRAGVAVVDDTAAMFAIGDDQFARAP